jgi:iron complex outermembrane receptor protein
MRNSLLFHSVSVLAFSMLGLDLAHAQDQEAATVDEIIVTAQKREQSLQDVPIVVTAVSGQLMQDAGVKDIKDLQVLTPGLMVTSTTSENVTTARIRGVGTVGDNPGLESSVGVVIDGVYRPRNGVSFGDLGPLSRVEVLKGPQGTLFGKNTSAGVINILSAKPGPKLAAQSEVSVGNYDAFAASQSISGPIGGDSLRGGLYVAVRKRDGFYDVNTNTLTAERRTDSQTQNFYTGRAQILYEPNSDFDLRIIADFTKRDEDCCVSVGINAGPTQAILSALAGVQAAGSRPFDRLAYSDRATPQKIEDKGISAEINWDTGWADSKLTSITALRKWTSLNGIDADYSLADLAVRDDDGSFFTGFKQFSQELRLAGSTGDFTWLVGGFFASEKLDFNQSLIFGRHLEPYLGLVFSQGRNPALVSTLAGRPFGIIPAGTGQVDTFKQDSKSYAFFTNNSYTLGKLELTVGLRYTIENKDLDAHYTNLGGGAACAATLTRVPQIVAALGAAATTYIGSICTPFSDPAFNNLTTAQERDEKEWSGTAKAAYRFNPKVLTYVSYARGYKAGGFNLDRARFNIGQPNPDTTFPGEFVDSYEAGVKSTLFGRTLLANATAFYQKYENFQLNTFTGISFVVSPIPKVVSKGVDADFVWFTPMDGLSFQGGVTYAVTQYGTFTPSAGISPRLSGARISFAPLWSASLSGTYERPISDSLELRTNISARYTSSYNTGSDLNPGKLQKELTLVNARIGVGAKDQGWMVEAWAQNLFDEDYYQVVFDPLFQTGQLNAFLGQPRTYGMTLRFKY